LLACATSPFCSAQGSDLSARGPMSVERLEGEAASFGVEPNAL
jgi:hypothetical protein